MQATIELLHARALLGQKKVDAAAAALKRAKALSAATQRNSLRTMVEITGSRLETAQKRSQAAVDHLATLLPALQRNSAVQLELETRLAQCEALLQLGPKIAAQTCSTALEKDSNLRGFGRVARQAKSLASNSM